MISLEAMRWLSVRTVNDIGARAIYDRCFTRRANERFREQSGMIHLQHENGALKYT